MKVSVVTATYNDAENLKRTLDALLMQDYEEIESIIVDGGSQDGSVEVIREFARRFRGECRWVSERDGGLYAAANKGIRMASGDLIGCYWDVYASPDVISKMVRAVEREHTDGVHGDLLYIQDGKVVRYWKMGQGKISGGWMPGHPTLYLKKEVYEKYGLYQEKYKCSGDYEFMVRALKDGKVRLSYLPEILIHMFYGGLSTSGFGAYERSIREGIQALRENEVRYPLYVTLKRTVRTSVQFFNRQAAKQHEVMRK